MAEFNSPTFDAQTGTAGASPSSTYNLAKVDAGKLRIARINYVVDGAEATADTINLIRLKVGAVVVPSYCRVVTGTGLDINDLNIGTAANDNKYADALDTLDTASDIAFSGGDIHTAPEAVGDGGEDVIATCVALVTSTAASTAVFYIAYLDE